MGERVTPHSIIERDGDTWRIVSTGAYKDGHVYCHLASTTRGATQRNGFVPVQQGDWIDADKVEESTRMPSGFYCWNRSLQGAFRKGMEAWERDGDDAKCPYTDIRKWRGQVSWSRAYMNTWSEGRDWASNRANALAARTGKGAGNG